MYKVGDEALIKAEIKDDDGHGKKQIKIKGIEGYSPFWIDVYELIPADKTYTQGLADARELAQRVMKKRDWNEIDEYFKHFGIKTYCELFEKYAYEEALAKIEAYEKEKEIKVGDVVIQRDTQKKFLIVTEEYDNSVYEFGVIDLETLMLDRICNDTKIFKKTGKHIDIESLLKQIGE